MTEKILNFISNIFRLAVSRPHDLRTVFGTANSVLMDIINPEADTRSFPKVEIGDIYKVNSQWKF